MKKKVIDIVSTSQGAYRLLRTRVKKLNDDENIENLIMCPPGVYNDKIRKLGIRVIEIDFTRGLNPINVLKEIKEFKEIFMKEKPDIIHTHNSKPGVIGRLAAYKVNKVIDNKIKIIHQVHGYHFTKFKGIKRKIYEKIEYSMSKKTDFLLFQNKDEYELSKKMKMDTFCELKYIGNGIPFEEFIEYIEKEKTLNKNEKIFICVARIEPVKNHEMIIHALNELEKKYNFTNYKLNLIGEGKIEKLNILIKKYNLKGNINFIGQIDRDEVIEFLYKSDISILSSYKEGKPRALMESSALGVPIVATDVIGTNEVVKNNQTGYLVELHDYKNFAEKMYQLLNDEEKWQQFSEKAKEIAKEEFDENNVVKQLKELYINNI